MIQLKNLERVYKTPAGQTWVLRRINLEIREGEFITIMGPSGAGKSSLLNVLALLDDAWDGEYWFREHAVHDMKRKQRAELAKKNTGMVFRTSKGDYGTVSRLESARHNHRPGHSLRNQRQLRQSHHPAA